MIREVIRWLLTVLFGILMTTLFVFVNELYQFVKPSAMIYVLTAMFLVGVLIGMFISKSLAKWILNVVDRIVSALQRRSLKEILVVSLGTIFGLLLANLISLGFVFTIKIYGIIIYVALNLLLGYIGFQLAVRKKDEVRVKSFEEKEPSKTQAVYGRPKVLDTSVIIDGRILDILGTGFIDGTIIIPQFVLDELRHIADSADGLKRTRGRRGLDILKEMQNQLGVPISIVEKDYPEIAEVDSKLLKLAKEMNAAVITIDFNLIKVAHVQGVQPLNINELANAIKTILLPGEELQVAVVKDGKEPSQGIGYLEDGTMIVVEGGKKYLGQMVSVVVTSVIQTAAGKMIFTKINMPKNGQVS